MSRGIELCLSFAYCVEDNLYIKEGMSKENHYRSHRKMGIELCLMDWNCNKQQSRSFGIISRIMLAKEHMDYKNYCGG